jgi:hypothetical protein
MDTIILITQIKNTGGGMHILPIPDGALPAPLAKHGNRFLFTIEPEYTFHGALLYNKQIGLYVMASKKLMKEAGVQSGDEVQLIIREDASPDQFEMPEELSEVMKWDPEANALFQQLTPGGRRSIMAMIQRHKTEQKRIDLALIVAERLKQGFRSPRHIFRK